MQKLLKVCQQYKDEGKYFLAKKYCEELKDISGLWLGEDSSVRSLCFGANIILLDIFNETGDAKNQISMLFKNELLINSAVVPADFAKIPAGFLANDTIYALLLSNIEEYYEKIKAYVGAIAQTASVNEERLRRLEHLLARRDFLVKYNELKELSKSDFLLKTFIENNNTIYENLNISAEVVLQTQSIDLVLYFLRRPDLSEHWISNQKDINHLLTVARQPRYKIIAKCLYFYKHLNFDDNIKRREELAVLVGLSDKKIKKVNNLQPEEPPLESLSPPPPPPVPPSSLPESESVAVRKKVYY